MRLFEEGSEVRYLSVIHLLLFSAIQYCIFRCIFCDPGALPRGNLPDPEAPAREDDAEIATVEELREMLNPTTVPDFEGVARTGVGVFDTLKAVAKLVLTELRMGGP